MPQAPNILSIGASRNIGYFSSIRLLGIFRVYLSYAPTDLDAYCIIDSGATVTFLLRSPGVFDSDNVIQKYVKSGHARLLKGDALIVEDVQRAWDEAAKDRPVDVLLFTVGEFYILQSIHNVSIY